MFANMKSLRHINCLLNPHRISENSDLDQNIIGLSDQKIPKFIKKPKIAIILHGTACPWRLMVPLRQSLEEHYDDTLLIAFNWQLPIEENAFLLSELINKINPHVKQIDIHGYSMGGLIARKTLEENNSRKIKNLYTYSCPHLGTPLAKLSNLVKIFSYISNPLQAWDCDGVRDMIPDSNFLKNLKDLKKSVSYTFIGGNSGSEFIFGITQPIFWREENDGVVSLESQLDHASAKKIILPLSHLSVIEDPQTIVTSLALSD